MDGEEFFGDDDGLLGPGADFGQDDFADVETAPKVEKKINAFEESLNRLADLRKNRSLTKLPEKEGKQLAQKTIEVMVTAQSKDKAAMNEGKPAMNKLIQLKAVNKAMKTAGMREYFLQAGGLEAVGTWMEPIPDKLQEDRPIPPPSNIVDWCVKMCDYLKPDKEAILITGVGKHLRGVVRAATYPRETRDAAHKVVQGWVSIVLGADQAGQTALKKRRREAAEDAAERAGLRGADEAIEVRDKRSKNQLALPNTVTIRSEEDKMKFWTPDEATHQKYQDMMQTRHAHMVLDKPAFTYEHLPASIPVPSLRGAGPTSKLDANIRKMTNPNKKSWKNITKQISVAGQHIQRPE